MNYGRKIIYTTADVITPKNVAQEVSKAYTEHVANHNDADTLYDVFKGKTKILDKVKEVRENINHLINENRAYEIVKFHKGYVFGEPIQYVRRENSKNEEQNDEKLAEDINALNGYMVDANKHACDNKLAEWLYVSGTSYRLTLPNPKWEKGNDEPPFVIYSLDPRNTFVVYSNKVGNKPMFAVHYVQRENGVKLFSVYTENSYYEVVENSFGVYSKPLSLGMIPIIEYPADSSRLGVFEVALPLLDALDELQSNRMDDVVQFVNSFLAILGGQLDEETYKKLNEWKMLCLPEGVDAKYLSVALSQTDIQTLKDDIYQSILTICGVPNRNGGSSTSDTGSAVIMRDGWESAEARAKDTETVFKESERQFLKLVLRILRDTVGTSLKLTDITTHFTRRNYENLATKSQVLISMLNSGKVHPELAFAYCGMFIDPESAYLQSKQWIEEEQQRADIRAGALSELQEKTNGLERTGTDKVPEVQKSH